MRHWYAVVNQAEARFFVYNPKTLVTLKHRMLNPLVHLEARELASDKPGVDKIRFGHTTVAHSMNRESDPHMEGVKQFVKTVAKWIDQSGIESLKVVADDRLLGLIGQDLTKPIDTKIHKNWTNLSDHQVAETILELESHKSEERLKILTDETELEGKPGQPEKVAEEDMEEIPFPVRVSFRDMEPSDAVRNRILDRVSRLERFNWPIQKCHVIASSPHRHSQKGKIHHLEIVVHIPGEDIIINREPEKDEAHEDIYVAIRDAFDALERRMDSVIQKKQGYVKHHPS